MDLLFLLHHIVVFEFSSKTIICGIYKNYNILVNIFKKDRNTLDYYRFNHNYIFLYFFQLRFEYFVIVAVSVIMVLIMVLIAATILLIRLCRKRILLSSPTNTTLVGETSNGNGAQKSCLSNDNKKLSSSTVLGLVFSIICPT